MLLIRLVSGVTSSPEGGRAHAQRGRQARVLWRGEIIEAAVIGQRWERVTCLKCSVSQPGKLVSVSVFWLSPTR